MLFELINKAQSMLSELHLKSQESLLNENKLYDEMLNEHKTKLSIQEKARENDIKEKAKLKEFEKKKQEEYLDLINMDEDKENKLRLQWLQEREKDGESDDNEDDNLDILKNYISEFIIPDKDLLIINLIKSLMTIISKLKGFNTGEFLGFIFKEIRKLHLIENQEIFKLIEKKGQAKYDRLINEKFVRFREFFKKSSEQKYGNYLEYIFSNTSSDQIIEELCPKKPDFYMDITHNHSTASDTHLSKTVSLVNEDKILSDLYTKDIILEKPIEPNNINNNMNSQNNSININNNNNKKSRYQTDFEEIASIGKGSFGEVIKAKNRLDGRYYAIKKIKIYQGNFLKRIMREVQTLSLMHHQYVLRYYQAWLEEVENTNEKIVNFYSDSFIV